MNNSLSFFQGKRISVFGDSISTLKGYNPPGYSVYYNGDYGITSPSDTWWGMVIQYLGAQLLVNNSFSGSRVALITERQEAFPSACSDERCSSLHIGSTMPDIILIYIGTNDYLSGIPLRYSNGSNPYSGLSTPTLEHSFYGYYYTMLRKLRNNYPNAKIICMELCRTKKEGDESFVYPESYYGQRLNDFNSAIYHSAKQTGCSVIDGNPFGTFEALDGSHPTKRGMVQFANIVLNCLAQSNY